MPRKAVGNEIDQMMTLQDVAFRLQLHVETVRLMLIRGEVVASKVGPQWRVAPADLATYLERRRHVAVERPAQTCTPRRRRAAACSIEHLLPPASERVFSCR